MGELRESHSQERVECSKCHNHTAAYRCAQWRMDAERSGAHLNILWHAHHPSRHFSRVKLRHLCSGECDDRFVVDYHCHNRHSAYGYRTCTRLCRRMDSRCYYLGSLLWRQDFTAVRYHYVGIRLVGRSVVRSYPLHGLYYGAVDSDSLDSVCCGRTAV